MNSKQLAKRLCGLLVGGVLALFSASASAQVTNGNFENGFTGWTRVGDTLIVGNTLGTGIIEGNQQAFLATHTDGTINSTIAAGSGASSDFESLLGLQSGSVAAVGNGHIVLGSGLSQSLSLSAGQVVTFSWDFMTNQTYQDGTPKAIAPKTKNNDFAFAAFTLNGTTAMVKLADTFFGYAAGSPFTSGFSLTNPVQNPFISETGFHDFSLTVQTTGTYSFAVGVVHVSTATQDNGVNSSLLVDNIQVSTPPFTVTLQSNSQVGGPPNVGTLNFPSAAPPGTSFTVSSDNSAAGVPSGSTDVSTGANTATFPISTTGVDTTQTAHFTVNWNGGQNTATLTITPAIPSLVVLPTPTVFGGNTVSGVIQLNGSAGPSGVSVNLSSDNLNAATVPVTVTVPAGTNYKSFTITTLGVDTQQIPNISGSAVSPHTGTASAALTVNPAGVKSLALNPATINGGSSTAGIASLNGKAGPSGLTLNLSGDSGTVVPATTIVPAGANYKSFNIGTVAVSTSVNATISASDGTNTAQATLTINAATVIVVKATPSTITGGGSTSGMVQISGKAGTGGVVVNLQSDDPSATVPSTVTVPAGSNYVSFTIGTVATATTKTPHITGTIGASSQSVTVTVNPPSPTSVTLTPSTVVGGTISKGRVILDRPAPAGGLVIQLSLSDGTLASVPTTVTVAAGLNYSPQFNITTNPTLAPTSVYVIATYNAKTAQALLSINPN